LINRCWHLNSPIYCKFINNLNLQRQYVSITNQNADRSDISELVNLINTAYRGGASKKGWTTEADLVSGNRVNEISLAELFNTANIIFRKCLDDRSQIVGCSCLEKRSMELYTSLLTVSPEMQECGVGKMLLIDAEEIAMASGLPSLALTVISARTELIDYYLRRGFQRTGNIFDFPINSSGSRPLRELQLAELRKFIDVA